MEGWLHVRKNCSSGSGFVWSERYFVLRDGQLGLFNRRDEPEPRRVYQLRSDCSVTVMEDKDGSTYLRVLWETLTHSTLRLGQATAQGTRRSAC